MQDLSFPKPLNIEGAEALRTEVRAFVAKELAGASPPLRIKSWSGFDPDFSRKLGERGWIGMTWPKIYGGHERSALERYIVIEELLAAGAPVAAHWIADRQSGPLILRVGTEAQKQAYIPQIISGSCYFCIGMSEPNSGSDLAATQTRAVKIDGGWRVNGTKLWTTNAHRADYMLLFCRTGAQDDRHGGTSQFIVDLKREGITIRPIADLSGAKHFNEVVFQDVFLPDSALLGTEGEGWKQVMSELAFERSGPDRFLSTYGLLVELIRVLGAVPSDQAIVAVGRLGAHLATLRHLSRSVATMLEHGNNPTQQASIVKDLGTTFEQEIPEVARLLQAVEPVLETPAVFEAVLAYAMMNAPSFSLRGGTREILRGIIARGLGLR